MFKKLLITLIFVLGSVPAFAQVDTAGMKRYDEAQDIRQAANHMPDDSSCCRMRGDCNNDSAVGISDLSYLVDYLFFGGNPPPCVEEGDVDGSGAINVADLTYLVDFIFFGGPPPPPCP